jgi:hypothetical protein
MSDHLSISDAEADARLAALFGDAPRPPMGDEAFVRGVSGRVAEIERGRRNRLTIAAGLALAAGAVALMVNGPSAVGALADSFAGYLQYAHQLGGGASALLLAAALSAVGWAYAERG